MAYQHSNRRDTYQEVTDAIIRQLENGAGAWRRPWANVQDGLPRNLNNRPYRGINIPLTLGAAMERGYSSHVWGTYKAWQERSAQVRKGERGTQIVFWKIGRVREEDDETGETRDRKTFLARGYTVFAAEQVEGFDLDAYKAKRLAGLPNKAERLTQADAAASAYLDREAIPVRHGGDRAFYSPSTDFIAMPPREAFHETQGYYSTLLHEIGHSTGHEKRLAREFGKRFGDLAYAFEELIAELTSAMLCGALAIEDSPRKDHAQYLANWLQVLRQDKRAIFTAASKAQAAADLVMDKAEQEEIREAA